MSGLGKTRTLQAFGLVLVALLSLAFIGSLAVAPNSDGAALPSADPTASEAVAPTPGDGSASTPAPAATRSAEATASPAPKHNTFYVSRMGNGGDGKTWRSAWKELDRIDWDVVQPGDVILIDGGADEMVYETTLTVGRSGKADAPITLKLADEPSRDGQVVIFGGRQEPLPYCDQSDYDPGDGAIRDAGVDFGEHSWVVLDGTKWRGIAIHGHGQHGIMLSGAAKDILVRNVEIFDNGSLDRDDGKWYPSQDGVRLSGTRITFERAIVHDNGEDAFQSNGNLRDFTLRESWLYNTRKDAEGGVWNYCRHPDGIQVWDGGEQRGIKVERSVIGPGFMHGILLGDEDAVVHDLTVRDTLIYGNRNANVQSSPNQPKPSKRWLFENVTSDRPAKDKWANVGFQWKGGYGDPKELTIRDSVFSGGFSMEVPAKGGYKSNVFWQVGGTSVGNRADPRYADPSVLGSEDLDADFRLAADSPAAGLGTTITSSKTLLSTP